MGAPLPILFSAAPLPPGAKTPQDWADALVARLVARSTISIAFFVTGATAPTSDVGPWLNTGANPGWYFWDIGTSAYIPMPIPQASLKWYIGPVVGTVPPDPDPAVYSFWIVLNGSGVAIDIQTYSGGAWNSIWAPILAGYSTTAQMNAAIAAATPVTYPFKVEKTGAQTFTAGAGAVQITWENEIYDPDGVFATNVFTAPVNGIYQFVMNLRIDCSSGTPTGISILPKLRLNGVLLSEYNDGNSVDTGGRTNLLVVDTSLMAGDVVDAVFEVNTTGASTWDVRDDYWKTYFSGHMILKL